jgi:hypothetical protein
VATRGIDTGNGDMDSGGIADKFDTAFGVAVWLGMIPLFGWVAWQVWKQSR